MNLRYKSNTTQTLSMAPHKQPRSLFAAAHHTYSSLILSACVCIQHRCGDFDSEECVGTVGHLQSRLATLLPSSLWTSLCESCLTLAKTSQLRDLRIVYALFASPKLTRVAVSAVNAWSNTQQRTVTSDRFWADVFARLANATHIELDGKFDECFVSAIGDHCCHLESIVLPYNVSWPLIASLLKCTKLRRVRGNHWCQFSPAHFRLFVESLPDLEYVDVPNLVECFAEMDQEAAVASLKLTYLCLLRATATRKNINLVTRICPDLRHLQIDFRSREESVKILDILAHSSVKLTSLIAWSHFPSADKCLQFFSLKGFHLLHLKLTLCQNSITLALLNTVAEHCPNLTTLDVDVTRSQSDCDGFTEVCPSGRAMLPPLFNKLTSLGLEDWGGERTWDPRIVETCLANATNLETLSLVNVYKRQVTAECFRVLFDGKRVSRLVDVKLKMGPLSAEMVRCVYDNCSQMRTLTLRDPVDNATEQYLRDLQMYVANNNIDLKLDYFVIKDR